MIKLPELLAPAGSGAALEAAIDARADAVYLGGSAFNARMGALNFEGNAMREYVSLAHRYSVKCYLTLNTLAYDRELRDVLTAAADAADAGVDAIIVADLGVASLIKRHIPEIPLHASTQASGHNRFAAAELKKLGFSRMVIAREASMNDIKSFKKSSDLELEVFVHGALCVSHSGQCLFSSVVGGRSGNRGECAQPCRLPFCVGKKEKYPLSLKDSCLASHIPFFIENGVDSLKIEGRMKSPEYVHRVVSIYRALLDERRAATPDELRLLAEAFSRGGFTDGYFSGRLGSHMLGIRSDSDKADSRAVVKFDGIKRKVGLDISAEFSAGEPSSLRLSANGTSVTVTGDEPLSANTAPMSKDDFSRSLSRLGGTPYTVNSISISASDGLMMPVSRLNALRRDAIAALGDALTPKYRLLSNLSPVLPKNKRTPLRSARFLSRSDVTDAAREYFDIIYLPLERYDGSTRGIIMPPVVFDREIPRVTELLANAKELGATDILVGNVGQVELARKFGFTLHGDLRLNVTNSETAAILEELGFCELIASPELTLPRLRDLGGATAATVYGKLPLMLLEKCVIREISGCLGFSGSQVCRATLTDRRGVDFTVIREGEHRNTVYNSLPTCMSDRESELQAAGILSRHFIFTDESHEEVDRVIKAFTDGVPLGIPVRRINK